MRNLRKSLFFFCCLVFVGFDLAVRTKKGDDAIQELRGENSGVDKGVL
jgi:hypothetical protein